VKMTLRITQRADLWNVCLKSKHARVEIPELEFEVGPARCLRLLLAVCRSKWAALRYVLSGRGVTMCAGSGGRLLLAWARHVASAQPSRCHLHM
jgi:hypothetical protein